MKPWEQWKLFAEQIRSHKPDKRSDAARAAMEQTANAAEKVAKKLEEDYIYGDYID